MSSQPLRRELAKLAKSIVEDYTDSTQWDTARNAVRQDLQGDEKTINDHFNKIDWKIKELDQQLNQKKLLDANRVKLMHIESAAIGLRLRLVTLKLSKQADVLTSSEKEALQKKRENLEHERKAISRRIGKNIQEILKNQHADEQYLQDIEAFSKPERELAEALDQEVWLFKTKNQQLLFMDPHREEFAEKAGELKVKRASCRYDWSKFTALKNSLSSEIGKTRSKDQKKELNDRLNVVKKKLSDAKWSRRQLREQMLEAMLLRALDVYPKLDGDNKTALLNRFNELQKQYRESYDYSSSNRNKVSFERYSPDKIMTPEEVDFRMRCVKAGYDPEAASEVSQSIESLKGWLTVFNEWARKNPDIAQYMIDDLSLLVAALNEEELTQTFAETIDYVTENASRTALPKNIQGTQLSMTLKMLEVADAFRNLYATRKDLLKDLNLEDLSTTVDLLDREVIKPYSGRNGLKAFQENLTFLRLRSLNLQRSQAAGAIQKSGHFEKVVKHSLIKNAMQKAKKEVKRKMPIKLKPRFSVRFKQWGVWTKKIFVNSSWLEKGFRASALGVAALGGGLFVGGGIALAVLTAGIGAAGGAALIAAGGGVFVALFSTMNHWIDDFVEWNGRDSTKIGKKILAATYLKEIKSQGVLPDYGKAKLKSRAEKKLARGMADQIMNELELPPHRKPLPEDYVGAFKSYVNDNFPNKGAFIGEKEEKSIYAINYAIDKLLSKKIKESVENIPWEDPGDVTSPEKVLNDRLKQMGLSL